MSSDEIANDDADEICFGEKRQTSCHKKKPLVDTVAVRLSWPTPSVGSPHSVFCVNVCRDVSSDTLFWEKMARGSWEITVVWIKKPFLTRNFEVFVLFLEIKVYQI